jgi:hypothetical protein
MKDAKGFDVSYNAQISVDSKHKLIAKFNVTNDRNDMKQLLEMATKTSEFQRHPTLIPKPIPDTITQVKSPNVSKAA